MRWACADPAEPEVWPPGARLLTSHTLTTLPARVHDRLPAAYQEMLSGLAEQRLPQVEEYRRNLLRLP
ncbi:hypothetical protein ABZ078_17775 [Streptomyces sp. NPDC006385]|uniref:hypothetical protein n=1 Tax=Streptomyces sp. NPDC006385 TaxID=3156761 RepID=UPI0033A356D5